MAVEPSATADGTDRLDNGLLHGVISETASTAEASVPFPVGNGLAHAVHSMPMPDVPLAYLISFRCYGTWLHGDERGSFDRQYNQYGGPAIPENRRWRRYNARKMTQALVTLSLQQRKSVEYAIRETCLFRNWNLHAVNVRTNHAHSLITAYLAPNKISVDFAVENGLAEGFPPERILNALNANATRQMRMDGLWASPRTPWADGGSTPYIWSEFGLARAKDYVLNGQNGPIPEFDKRKTR